MDSFDYSPKEILILESVVDLFLKGYSLYTLKVADIAAGAGIGKGTIYEYFSSKEEIIAKAIAYRISREILQIASEIENISSFRQCTLAIFTKCFQCHNQMMLLKPETIAFKEVGDAVENIRITFQEMEKKTIKKYLAIGVRDGSISAGAVEKLGEQVVISCFSGFHVLLMNDPDLTFDELFKNTHEIIVKALQ